MVDSLPTNDIDVLVCDGIAALSDAELGDDTIKGIGETLDDLFAYDIVVRATKTGTFFDPASRGAIKWSFISLDRAGLDLHRKTQERDLDLDVNDDGSPHRGEAGLVHRPRRRSTPS